MCVQLRSIREAFSEIAQGLDPSLLTASDAEAAVVELAAIESTAAALKAVVAVRAAESGSWRRDGHRSAAEALARRTGTSTGVARRVLDTGRRLAELPEVRHAATSGGLSGPQTELIAEAGEVDPSSSARLVESARTTSLSELKDQVAGIKTAHSDIEARHREIHARRSLRHWTDTDGAWHLHATGTISEGAKIMSVIAAHRDRLFHQARREGRRENPDAYAFDALTAICQHATSTDPAAGDPPPGRRSKRRNTRRGAAHKVLVRVDYESLLRGQTIEGEVCEIAGYGPVPVAVVADILADKNTFLAAILTRAKRLVGVAHPGRAPTATQQSALEWIYPTCAAQGCAAHARLERDHRIDWNRTYHTLLDELDRFCHFHHSLKTRNNWALTPGHGKRAFVAPTDPRHPKHTQVRPP